MSFNFVLSCVLKIMLLCVVGILLARGIGTRTTDEILLFTSDRDGDTDIYLFDLRRGLTLRLFDSDEYEEQPQLSPDGTRIAYSVRRLTGVQIDVFSLVDGTSLTIVVPNNDSMFPVWSPDGSQIAFSAGRSSAGFLSIALANAHSSVVENRTLSLPNAEDRVSAWFDTQILYSAIAETTWAIYALDIDRYERRLVVDLEGGDFDAVWSPDGSQIAFASFTDTVFQVYVMNSDGSRVWQLTYDSGGSSQPVWSPSGRRILYSTSVDFRTRELYIMDSDGQNQQRLTYNDWDDVGYGWLP